MASDMQVKDLRGVASFETDEILIFVKADMESVARAFRKRRKFATWVSDAHGKNVPGGDPCFVVYQLSGHSWVIIDSLRDSQGEPLSPADAKGLSRALKTTTIFYGNSDTGGALGYEVFEGGTRVEHLDCFEGQVRFKSTLRRKRKPRDEEAAQGFVDAFLREQDVFAPGWSTYLRLRAPRAGEEAPLDLGDEFAGFLTRLDYFSEPQAAPPKPPKPKGLSDADVKLLRSCASGDVQGAGEALAEGACLECRTDYMMEGPATPLMIAAREGHEPVVELLLAAGSDIHACQEGALHYALKGLHSGVIEILLKAGADPLAPGPEANLTALELLMKRTGSILPYPQGEKLERILGLAKRLLANGAKVDPPASAVILGGAARCGAVPLIQLFLDYGADPNSVGASHEPPLLHAISEGHLEAVSALLNGGASPNIRVPDAYTPQGSTLLIHAVHYRHKEIVRLLLDAGAEVNAKDNEGRTALDHSTVRKGVVTTPILREAGGKRSDELAADGQT